MLRVPTVQRHGKETSDSVRRTSRARCKRKQLKQHMLSFHGRRLRVIPSKRAFSGRIESVRCRGSSCSRAVVEVDVHGSSWEVVVHGVVEVVVHVATVVVHVFVDVQVDGSGTRDVGVLVGPVLAV